MQRELFKACENPECDRQVSFGVLYCCIGCSNAHEGKFEIHEKGSHWICAHSDTCDERHRLRGAHPSRMRTIGLSDLKITRRLIIVDDPVMEPLSPEKLRLMQKWWQGVQDRIMGEIWSTTVGRQTDLYSTTYEGLSIQSLRRAMGQLKPAKFYLTESWTDKEHIICMAPNEFEQRTSYVCHPDTFRSLEERIPGLRDLVEVHESKY